MQKKTASEIGSVESGRQNELFVEAKKYSCHLTKHKGLWCLSVLAIAKAYTKMASQGSSSINQLRM